MMSQHFRLRSELCGAIAYCIYGLTVTCGFGTRDAAKDG